MKRLNPIGAFCLLLILGSLTSCLKDKCDREVTYVKSIPIFQTLEEIRKPIVSQPNTPLVNPGKIYNYGNYIFINEVREGFHIYNNEDPSNPMHVNFVAVPGNKDISISNGVLYADNYLDLLAIDISDAMSPSLISRSENVFPADSYDEEKGYLVDYYGELVTEPVDCAWMPDQTMRLLEDSNDASFSGSSSEGVNKSDYGMGASGIAGSLSKFSLIKDHLYVIDDADMHLFSISNPTNPVKTGSIDVGFNIETIYSYGDNLFIGATDGMYIYDNSNPNSPQFANKYTHVTACDPVVVNGDYAYVTLRSGTECGNTFTDELQIVNVSDINNPYLESQTNMSEPKGLAVDSDNTVFVCDGVFGLKVYDVENARAVQIDEVNGIDAFDVILIPDTERLLVIGHNGLHQFEYSQDKGFTALSSISLN